MVDFHILTQVKKPIVPLKVCRQFKYGLSHYVYNQQQFNWDFRLANSLYWITKMAKRKYGLGVVQCMVKLCIVWVWFILIHTNSGMTLQLNRTVNLPLYSVVVHLINAYTVTQDVNLPWISLHHPEWSTSPVHWLASCHHLELQSK